MRRLEPAVLTLAVLTLAACRTAPAPRSAPPGPPPSPATIDRIPDAVPRAEPRSRHGNPAFYEVFGRRYFVLPSSSGYRERGVASWYGADFHGGRTANGDQYDMHAMTAAHKTLPLPSYVQVINLKNGKTITVRVNDRGPFVANRLIDLSYTAAAKLDMIRDGTTLVEVRAVDGSGAAAIAAMAPPAGSLGSPAPAKFDELYVQAGAFSEPANAERLLERLRAAGLGVAFVRRDEVDGRPLYRVRVGPVPSVAEFDRLVEKLRGVGITDARLAAD